MHARDSSPSFLRRIAALLASLLLAAWPIVGPVAAAPRPGGPLTIGGANFGISGVPFTWDPAAMPIQYRIDPGPMSKSPSGAVVVDNAAGIARVNASFANWAAVPTASISRNYAGALLASGAYTGGPIVSGDAVANLNAVTVSCSNFQQSPIIFDPTGSLLSQLGLSSSIIGITNPCGLDPATGRVRAAAILLNGKFQDGVSSSMPANVFDQAITHEIGHLLGLDHSQINVDVLNQGPNCSSTEVAGLPIMFPFAVCFARSSYGFPVLSPDDNAWISRLYPVTAPASGKTPTNSAYGTISGTVFFSDGVTGAQGVNVIARSTANPSGVAFSAVSGYLFTSSLGQSVTCVVGNSCNAAGSSLGSRDTRFVGTFDIPVTPGTYTVQVESINPSFTGGSGVGPLRSPPIPMPGSAPSAPQVSVSAGGSVIANITLQGTASRFDSFESSELILRDSLPPWLRRDQLLSGTFAR